MTKDPNKDLLDSIEEEAFYRRSVKEEMDAYLTEENKRQREEGKIGEDNLNSINLKETPDPQTKKQNFKMGVWGVAALTAILIIAVIVCMKIAN